MKLIAIQKVKEVPQRGVCVSEFAMRLNQQLDYYKHLNTNILLSYVFYDSTHRIAKLKLTVSFA